MSDTVFNEDCISGAKSHLRDESVDLLINDPPFGINEASFGKHYKRRSEFVIEGYQEAPEDYFQFTLDWMTEAKRVLKPNGSMYVISGWSNLRDVLNALHKLEFVVINHIIWKFNFGVNTKKKYVTSHYHVLYVKKTSDAEPTFNTYCRFGSQERTEDGKGSLNFQDIEDVFVINKDYLHATKKNANKLPDELIQKLILYSSNTGDVVCDFFLGNFTTAIVAKRLGRVEYGFEINKESFDINKARLDQVTIAEGLKDLKNVVNLAPENQGKPVTDDERDKIWADYKAGVDEGKSKKAVSEELQKKYGRGKFAIKNIIDKCLELYNNSKTYEATKKEGQ